LAEGKAIHLLFQIKSEIEYIIHISVHSFSFSKPQILLLSITAFEHFENITNPLKLWFHHIYLLNKFFNTFSTFTISFQLQQKLNCLFWTSNIPIYCSRIRQSFSFFCLLRSEVWLFFIFWFKFVKFKDISSKTLDSMNNYKNPFSCNSAYIECISDLIWSQIQFNRESNEIKF
jgi:hypothetical protein